MHLALSGLGADIREIPDYCIATSFDPRSWFRGLLPSCAPYTTAELEAMTASQMTQACAGPDGIVDFNCRQAGIEAARASAAAAAATDPEGACEYTASQEHPTLSSILGTKAVCDLYAGKYTAYIIAGVAAVGLLLLSRKRRY